MTKRCEIAEWSLSTIFSCIFSVSYTHLIKYILISGDNRKEDYNEPEEMKKALIQKGIPEKFIYLDYAGFRTLDSVVRAKEVFGQNRLTIISQRFHNERAIYLAEKKMCIRDSIYRERSRHQ